MKHKLKQLITLMGTALLGHQPTMATPPLEPPSPESVHQGGNDSFLSKLDTPTNQTRAKREPSRLSFSKENYDVYEEMGIINIRVERSNCDSNSPAIAVKYASHNGSAIAQEDYQTVEGTLTWGKGECYYKAFNVPITDDRLKEGNETLHLKLSEPTGEVELAQNDAVLRILDNESSVIGFSQANYLVNEADEIATITVERTD
ncbi:MAG: Calx-beta domain-containing protein [Candidatus Parabeggiatoa sp.]|nr:Calx-beta domain-containing protein [Candidatus Parabeggiatoa sp.]